MDPRPGTALSQPRFSLGAMIGFRLVIVAVLLFIAGYLDALPTTPSAESRQVFTLISIAFGLNLLYAVLLGLASYRVQAAIQVIGDLAVTTGLVYLTGVDRTGFVILFPVSVLCGTVLLGRGYTFAWIATFFYAALVLLVRSEVIPPYGLVTLAFGPVRDVVTSIGLTALSCLVVAALGQFLARSLKETGATLDQAVGQVESLRELNRLIVENMPSGLLLTDSADRITFANGPAEMLLGHSLEALRGRRSEDVLDLSQAPEGWETLQMEVDYATPAGERRILAISGHVLPEKNLGRLFVFSDRTELQRLQDRAHVQEKLAAIGGAAAQLAHEIRNPLGAIGASAKLLAESGVSAGDQDLLKIIRSETERLNATITAYLGDLKPESRADARCDVAAAVSEMARLVDMSPERTEGHRVRVDVPGAPIVAGISKQDLTQVLWNLARNGLEAMPRGGELRLSVREKSGGAEVEVADEGEGFDSAQLRTLFEPLRTTKQMGTGLGLAIAHRIMRRNRGDLLIHSLPGQGTTARLTIGPAVGD